MTLAAMNPTPTLFRWLLATNLILVVAASLVDIIFPSLIPQVLSDAQAKLSEADSGSESLGWLLTLGVAGLILFALVAASYVGLFFLRRWARRFAVLTTVLAMPFYFSSGPVIQSAVSALLLECSMIIWGAILAIAYFSPLKTCFAKPANAAVQPTPAA